MGLIASGSNKVFTPAPEGTHVAVCVQVIDLGLQHSDFYDKTVPKVLVGWELPDELDSEGKPFMVFHRYTSSTSKKAKLRLHLEAWRGKPFSDAEVKAFDIKAILGKACLVNIVHNETDGNTYANVSAVMALPKGTKGPAPKSKPFSFDIDNWDDKVFETFGDNLKKTIEGRVKLGDPTKTASESDAEDSYTGGSITDKDIPFAPWPWDGGGCQ